jgi:hypothetical protein
VNGLFVWSDDVAMDSRFKSDAVDNICSVVWIVLVWIVATFMEIFGSRLFKRESLGLKGTGQAQTEAAGVRRRSQLLNTFVMKRRSHMNLVEQAATVTIVERVTFANLVSKTKIRITIFALQNVGVNQRMTLGTRFPMSLKQRCVVQTLNQ